MSLSQMWLLICVAMIVVEVVTVGNLISIWFAIGAIIAYALTFITDSVAIQVIAFVVASILSMLLIRPLATKMLRGNVVATNADSIVGRQFVLAEAIDEDKWGKIKVHGDLWSCTTVDRSELEQGTRVEVVAIEGVKLIVRKIEE